MIATPPIPDLDDADSLEAADTPGALRSAASGGALVRATAEAVREGVLARLADLRPRSVLFVAGAGRAATAVQLLIAATAGRLGLAVMHAPALPAWVGSLDIVVVCGDDAGDPRLIDAVDRAVRRGAEVVVTAPDEGPLQIAAAGRAMLAPARVPVLAANTALHHVAVGLAVLRSVDPAHAQALSGDLDHLAELLDTEAVTCHPRNEIFHNPAKALAARMQGRSPVFAGDDAATVALARHAAEVLLRAAGRPAAAADLSDVIAAGPELAAGAAAPPGYDPLFHDEELDGPAPRDPARIFVLSTDPDPRRVQQRLAALPDADLLAASMDGGEPQSSVQSMPAGPVEQLMVLVLRLEMAAAYVKLTSGAGAAEGREAVL